MGWIASIILFLILIYRELLIHRAKRAIDRELDLPSLRREIADELSSLHLKFVTMYDTEYLHYDHEIFGLRNKIRRLSYKLPEREFDKIDSYLNSADACSTKAYLWKMDDSHKDEYIKAYEDMAKAYSSLKKHLKGKS